MLPCVFCSTFRNRHNLNAQNMQFLMFQGTWQFFLLKGRCQGGGLPQYTPWYDFLSVWVNPQIASTYVIFFSKWYEFCTLLDKLVKSFLLGLSDNSCSSCLYAFLVVRSRLYLKYLRLYTV